MRGTGKNRDGKIQKGKKGSDHQRLYAILKTFEPYPMSSEELLKIIDRDVT